MTQPDQCRYHTRSMKSGLLCLEVLLPLFIRPGLPNYPLPSVTTRPSEAANVQADQRCSMICSCTQKRLSTMASLISLSFDKRHILRKYLSSARAMILSGAILQHTIWQMRWKRTQSICKQVKTLHCELERKASNL